MNGTSDECIAENTNIQAMEELQRPETLKFLIFFEKTSKKCLTFGTGFVILLKLACPKEHEKSAANLENDTEKVNAQKGKISEDSKEFSTERC